MLHRVRAAGGDVDTPPGEAPARAALARAFQESVVDVLASKTARAAAEHGVREVIVAGGVAANGALREALQARCTVPVRWPPPALCTDNAAMIGAAACFKRPLAPPGADGRSDLGFDLFST